MANAVFLLCSFTSLVCAVLLLRAYRANGVRLLFWSGICFAGLALNNLLLFVDTATGPQLDLALWRSLPALGGVAALIYGLIWEGD